MVDDNEPLLDLDSRRRIYRHVEKNPGMHLRGLQRALEMPLGTIEYHLHQMEKSGLLTSRDDGRFKAFFASEGIDRRDKDILYYVRQEMPRQIVIRLLMEPGLSHSALTEQLPVSASTCSFHLKKLVAAGIVAEERVGRSKRFTVPEADRVANVLVRYRRSFLDDLVDRFARAWLDVDRASAAGAGGGDAGDDGGPMDAEPDGGVSMPPDEKAAPAPEPDPAAESGPDVESTADRGEDQDAAPRDAEKPPAWETQGRAWIRDWSQRLVAWWSRARGAPLAPY